jgi:hypothetical protein
MIQRPNIIVALAITMLLWAILITSVVAVVVDAFAM